MADKPENKKIEQKGPEFERIYIPLGTKSYEMLFDDSPVPLWEEDYREVLHYIKKLKEKGIYDFNAYFEENPAELKKCAQKVKINDVNKAAIKLHNARDKQELILNFDKIFTKKSYDVFKQEVIAIAEGRSEFESEAEVQTLTGEIRNVFLKLAIHKDSRIALLATTDITKRKRTEKALKLSLEKFEKAFLAAPIWVVLSALDDGRYLEVNEAYLKTMGYNRAEVIGKTSLELNTWVAPRDRESIMAQIRRQGRIRGREVQRRTRTGAIIDTLFSAEILSLEGGSVILSVTQDITEQRKAIAEQEKLQLQLFQAQKMESVGRLAGGVAHDFNNMLGVIMGRTEIMLSEMNPGDLHYDDLSEINEAARRSVDLTRQLLAFARKQAITPKVLDLNDTVEGMLKMLRHLIGEDIDLVWMPAAQIWPVKMDPAQVDQVMANLCVNARDAIAGTGNVTVGTENVILDEAYCATHPGSKPGHYVMLTVSDDGCGMDMETQSHLFEPFFTTKKIGEGTGLGLATVYGIVKQNEGFIYVYSEPGQGTTFRIYLPRTQKTVVEDGTRVRREEVAKGSETVLFVEDEESVLRLGQTILERHGYTVLAAGSPGEAIDMADRHEGPIHLLVTDVVMPEMNGKELMEQIQKINPHIKVIFMSGYPGNVISNRGIIEADVNFLQKPFSINLLAGKVRGVLDAR